MGGGGTFMNVLILAIVPVILIYLGSGAAFADHVGYPTITLYPFSAVTDGTTYTELDGASDITTTQIGSKHYALVPSSSDSGVQIINITDPANPAAVAAIADGIGGFTTLAGATGITTTQINSKHYALVAAFQDDGVQIIDITDPANPAPVAAITDGTTYPELNDASAITTTQINSKHYALVTAFQDDGVQIIDITDPANPAPVAAITNNMTYPELDGPNSITTTQINSKHYALVAATSDNGVQIIDITDPTNPAPAAAIGRSQLYPKLQFANDITTTQIGSKHYALVTAGADDGVQIIDITDPTNPAPVAAIADSIGGFTELDGARDITTTQIGSKHYALVAAGADNGVQLIDITDPANPAPVAAITDSVKGFTELDNASDITTTQIGSEYYALVAASEDDGIQIIGLTHPAGLILSDPSNRLAAHGPGFDLSLPGNDAVTINVRLAMPLAAGTQAAVTIHAPYFGPSVCGDQCQYHTHGDISFSKNVINFGSGNWSTPQQVTIQAHPDDDGNDAHKLIIFAIESDDPKFLGLPVMYIGVTTPQQQNIVQNSGGTEGSLGTIHRSENQPPQTNVQNDTSSGTEGNLGIILIPEQQAPTVSNAIADATIIHESGTLTISLSGVFSDADSDALDITAASSDETKASVSVSSDYSQLTVNAQARGTATITVTANDGNGGTVSDAFTVTVKAAPIVSSTISDVSGLVAGGDAQSVSLSGIFSDADSDALTVTASSSDNTKVTVSVASDGSALTVSGVAEGAATITVTARDVDGNLASHTFQVTVNAAIQEDPQTGLPDIVKEYDTNGDGSINYQEWQEAINAYTGGTITTEELHTISKARQYS